MLSSSQAVQRARTVRRGLLNIERRERDRKKMTAWLTTGENEESLRKRPSAKLFRGFCAVIAGARSTREG